jgi:hypothetical protein
MRRPSFAAALFLIGVLVLGTVPAPAFNRCAGRAEVRQIVPERRVTHIQTHRISFNVWRNECEDPDLETTVFVTYVYKLRQKGSGVIETSLPNSTTFKVIKKGDQNPVVVDGIFTVDESDYEPKILDASVVEVSFK